MRKREKEKRKVTPTKGNFCNEFSRERGWELFHLEESIKKYKKRAKSEGSAKAQMQKKKFRCSHDARKTIHLIVSRLRQRKPKGSRAQT